MNTDEKLSKIKALLFGAKKEEVSEVKDDVTLSEEVVEEVIKEEVSVKESPAYVTAQELSQVRQEFTDFKTEIVAMLSILIEENKKDVKEVPQELSKQEAKEEVKEEVELSNVEEIIHSPENEVEKKEFELGKVKSLSSIKNRVFAALSNN